MKQRSSVGFWVVLITLVIAAAAGMARQGQETMVLGVELELARIDIAELGRLQAGNQRLREQQISATELEALRADHAALPRLRAEIEALEKRAPAAR